MAHKGDLKSASIDQNGDSDVNIVAVEDGLSKKSSWRQRVLSVVWDSLDKSQEERKFIAKIDWWILCVLNFKICCFYRLLRFNSFL